MSRIFFPLICFSLLVLPRMGQADPSPVRAEKETGTLFLQEKENAPADTIQKKKLTLYFLDKDHSLTPAYKKRMVDAYFQQYPKLIKKYNKKSPKAVTFLIDKEYKGVAAASGGVIRYNPAWFQKNPEDIDVVTHELMHIVQGYRNNKVPSWVTEGIADYVRATEGINNEKANWRMPEPKADDSYTKSYRITARFFVWITQNFKKDFVKKLDKAAREKTYSADTWKELTGKTVDELWQQYLSDPALD